MGDTIGVRRFEEYRASRARAFEEATRRAQSSKHHKGKPKSGTKGGGKSGQSLGKGGGKGHGGGKGESRPGDWTCGQCGANVFASKSACFKCGTPKPGGGGGRYGGGGGSDGSGGGSYGCGGGGSGK